MRTILIGICYGLYIILQMFRGFIGRIIDITFGKEKGQEYKNKKFLQWARFTNRILGLNIKVIGKENIPNEVCVFVANHQSILDVPILVTSANRAIGFIGKKELLKIPVLGYWMKQVHCVPIDRGNVREAVKVINQGVENLQKGYSMGIFPEGTRAKNGIMKPFKKGSLKLATKAKVKIVPVAISGANKAYELESKFKRADIKITFGKAIDTCNLDKEAEKALAEKIEKFIESNL